MFKRKFKIDPEKHSFVIGLDVPCDGFWETLEDMCLLGLMMKELCKKFAEKTNRSEVKATLYLSDGTCREGSFRAEIPIVFNPTDTIKISMPELKKEG